MDILRLIDHPELMSLDTLYYLRSQVALYPYWQTARLLMIENLFLLHDTSFDDELRRSAVYITDRRRLFSLIEAAHYKLQAEKTTTATPRPSADRTATLIDSFLEEVPSDDNTASPTAATRGHRRPTAADATVDYVAYLMETEGAEPADGDTTPDDDRTATLIDNYISSGGAKIELPPEPQTTPEKTQTDTTATADQELPDEEFFTETLARIYVKQGRYSQALAIIKRLDLNYPRKNAYFADQIRFLEKLIINSNNKPKE